MERPASLNSLSNPSLRTGIPINPNSTACIISLKPFVPVVSSVIYNTEILQSIVGGIPVYVVNNFPLFRPISIDIEPDEPVCFITDRITFPDLQGNFYSTLYLCSGNFSRILGVP